MAAAFQVVLSSGIAVPLVMGAAIFVFILLSWRLGHGAWRAWTFLARYHYDGGLSGYLKTRRLLLEALQKARKSVTAFEAALIQTEIAILIPPEDKPRRFDYPKREDYKTKLAEWQENEAKRRIKQQGIFEDLVKWKVLEKERKLASSAKQRTELKQAPDSERPIININNPAIIDKNRDKVTRYFVVAQSWPDFQHEFQSFVKMNDGFFAPLFLVAGLMSRFDEEWSPIIDNYRSQLKDATEYTSRELAELQSFEFNCWLLWGPSIPLCNCSYWRTGAGMTDPKKDSLFYQYGYGDENNSIDVLVENGRSREFRDKVTEWLIQPNAQGNENFTSEPRIVAAAPRSLIGKINYGPAIATDKICTAQSAIKDKKALRMYLALDKNETAPGCPGSQYYSAYIWVMFVICDRNGAPIHGGKQERWRNLLPFFEHGNIADASTMQSLKENLAAKTVSALKEILTRPGDCERGICIRYACALDDSNCSDTVGVLFPHGKSQSSTGDGQPPILSGRIKRRPTRIVSLLQEMANWDSILNRAIMDGRLLLPGQNTKCELRDDYSSCRLPEVIDGFFRAVEESEAADNRDAAQGDGKQV
jgi:hypothetical protein